MSNILLSPVTEKFCHYTGGKYFCKKHDSMANNLTSPQKKEWAKLLFLKENLTQQEIADRVGVSRVTINKWAKDWEGLKLNLLQTREERIVSTLQQLDELDRTIAGRDAGKRYPTSAEADIRRKLTADLEALEQDASVRDIYNVSRGLFDFIKAVDYKKAKELAVWVDSYIKSKIQ